QRSKEEMKEAEILPAREGNDKRLNTFFDYLAEDCLCVLDNPDNIYGEIADFESEIEERKIKIEQKEDVSIRPEEFYLSVDGLKSALEQKAAISLEAFTGKGIEFSTQSNLDIRQDIASRKEEILKPLVDKIKDWHDLGWGVSIVCHNTGQAERLKELMEGYRLFSSTLANSPPTILIGDLSSGFRFPSIKLAVITEDEIFGQKVKRRPPPSHKIDAFLTQLQDLNIGDFIVHTIHGIGIYQGLKRLKIEDIENDFLLLEYQGGDKLYLPVQRLHLVGKYRGVEGKKPEIDKLGSTRWEKTKGRVKKIAEEMAKGLLELYAARKVVEGFSFSGGDRLFSEFEASFEYDETP
ncbi:MAG: CarD family transcriptional regulator, partial [Deltaproteobacteria bacterium]